MPTQEFHAVQGYAHCNNAMCPGYAQEPVDANKVETSWTIGENGGDGAFVNLVEKSDVSYSFVNESDVPCPGCEQPRQVTGEPRKQYVALSGHDPLYLARAGSGKFDAAKQFAADPRDAKIEELEGKLNKLLDALDGDK